MFAGFCFLKKSLFFPTQLDYALPTSKIATLSFGEFVGMVADNPDCKLKLTAFHSEIQNDHEATAKEEAGYKPIPVIQKVSAEDIQENYAKIKQDIQGLFDEELKKIELKKPKEEKGEGKKRTNLRGNRRYQCNGQNI